MGGPSVVHLSFRADVHASQSEAEYQPLANPLEGFALPGLGNNYLGHHGNF
jgi:hypothetical protein